MSVWCDQVFLTGGIVTQCSRLARDLADIVRATGQAHRLRRAQRHRAPIATQVRRHSLPAARRSADVDRSRQRPVHRHRLGRLRRESAHGCRPSTTSRTRSAQRSRRAAGTDDLKGQGPDGKLLVRLRESTDQWQVEQILVTLQQLPDICADRAHRTHRRRSCGMPTPPCAQGPALDNAVRGHQNCSSTRTASLLNGGSDGDNGQTGRKLVVDYYGPRVAIGGGALSGKDLSHIDRAGAYAARHAALHAVQTGADTCRVTVALLRKPRRPARRGVQKWTSAQSDYHRSGLRIRLDGIGIAAARSWRGSGRGDTSATPRCPGTTRRLRVARFSTTEADAARIGRFLTRPCSHLEMAEGVFDFV